MQTYYEVRLVQLRGLSKLTDANGNERTWNLDLQGRVTAKSYADASHERATTKRRL